MVVAGASGTVEIGWIPVAVGIADQHAVGEIDARGIARQTVLDTAHADRLVVCDRGIAQAKPPLRVEAARRDIGNVAADREVVEHGLDATGLGQGNAAAEIRRVVEDADLVQGQYAGTGRIHRAAQVGRAIAQHAAVDGERGTGVLAHHAAIVGSAAYHTPADHGDIVQGQRPAWAHVKRAVEVMANDDGLLGIGSLDDDRAGDVQIAGEIVVFIGCSGLARRKDGVVVVLNEHKGVGTRAGRAVHVRRVGVGGPNRIPKLATADSIGKNVDGCGDCHVRSHQGNQASQGNQRGRSFRFHGLLSVPKASRCVVMPCSMRGDAQNQQGASRASSALHQTPFPVERSLLPFDKQKPRQEPSKLGSTKGIQRFCRPIPASRSRWQRCGRCFRKRRYPRGLR